MSKWNAIAIFGLILLLAWDKGIEQVPTHVWITGLAVGIYGWFGRREEE